MVGSFNGGVAALILLGACLFRGKLFGLLILIAAAVTLAGGAPEDTVQKIQEAGATGKMIADEAKNHGNLRMLTMGAGVLLALLAVFFTRERED